MYRDTMSFCAAKRQFQPHLNVHQEHESTAREYFQQYKVSIAVRHLQVRKKEEMGISPKLPHAQTGAPQAARNRRASCMSFCWMVTRLAWIAQRFASWKRLIRKASVASCSAIMA
jgi:hypothetical protein